jgi:fused signal recognition particle receptor
LGKIKKRASIRASRKLRRAFSISFPRAVAGKSKVDEEVLDNLEEVLVSSDVGVTTTLSIIERIEARVAKDKYLNTSELNEILKEEIVALLEKNQE